MGEKARKGTEQRVSSVGGVEEIESAPPDRVPVPESNSDALDELGLRGARSGNSEGTALLKQAALRLAELVADPARNERVGLNEGDVAHLRMLADEARRVADRGRAHVVQDIDSLPVEVAARLRSGSVALYAD